MLCNLVGYETEPLLRLSVFITDMDVGAAACSLSQLCLVDVYRAGHAGKNEAVHHAAWTGMNLNTTGAHAPTGHPNQLHNQNVWKWEISDQTGNQGEASITWSIALNPQSFLYTSQSWVGTSEEPQLHQAHIFRELFQGFSIEHLVIKEKKKIQPEWPLC